MQFSRRAIIGITCAVICAAVAPAVHATTLPAGYAQLTYIESTGTQYIDTECVPTRNFRAVVDLSYTTTTGGGGFGYGAAGSAQSFRFWRTVADGVATYKVNVNDKYGTENHFPTTYLNDTGRHVVDISNSAKFFDGVRFGDTSGLTKTLAGSFYLFALRWGWNPYIGGFGSYRVFSCQLYEGTTLVRDFVPCVDGNGKGGLYDLVNGKMYRNKATGNDFVLGPLCNDFLSVSGENLSGARQESGAVSPAYGFKGGLSAGDTLLCTAPSVWTNAACDTAATCIGYKVYTNGVLYVEGDTTSFTYVHPASTGVRLVWQWDMEYRVSVTAGPGGTVSTSGAWLRPGESFAIDAVPDVSHEFCRWSDNVNAVLRHGHEAFAIGGDSPLKITAIFGGRLYVDGANGDDATTDGTSPATAYKTIGAAVSAAPSNTVVLVADGTYKPSALVSISKAVTVRSLSGVAEGVKVDGNAARHCFTLNHPQACLDTITIQNGKSDGSSYDYGVNVRIAANGGQVRNCIVRNGNHAAYGARDNGGGAGIGCISANGIVVGCVITNNQFGKTSGTQQGVGLYMKAGIVVDSFIGYNKATSRNQDVPGVAGAFLSGSARMANCTVAGNNGISAGGVDAYSDNVRVYNTFIWGNVANADGDVFVGKAGCFSNCVARYAINGLCRASASSCASGRLYVPNAASPCIDASVAVPGIPLPPRDILGNPRVSGVAADIGAVEFQSGTPQVAISLSDASFICPREVTLTAATSGIEGVVKYVWDFDGDGVDDEETTVPSVTHSYDTPAYSTPRVTVVHAGGSTAYALPANSVKALPRTVYVNRLSTSPAIPYATPETAAKTLAAAVADAVDGQEIVLLAEGSPYSVTSETAIRRAVTVRGSTGNPADVVYRRSSGNTLPCGGSFDRLD